jgi:two-component system cell cycle response regulator DivK
MSAKHIMIVDDNASNLRLAAYVLQAAGFAVETALDAMTATARLKHFPADLILIDIQMPGVDGLTLLRQLKADPAFGHVPMIAFTAYAMKGDEARLRAAGCDGYLSKPVLVATFAAEVSAFLDVGNPARPVS